MPESASKNLERQYLLGTLSPDEEIQVEEAFIADDRNFDQLEIAEDELIDAYAWNELSAQDRKQFEIKLLTSPRIVERVNFARALAQKAASENPLPSEGHRLVHAFVPRKTTWRSTFFNRSSGFPLALAASIAVVVVGAGLVLFSWRQLRNESERLANERSALQKQKEESDKSLSEQQNKNEQLAADLQRQRDLLAEERRELDERRNASEQPGPRGLPGAIVSLALSPGFVRDPNQLPQLNVGAGVETVQLNLLLAGNEYRSYRAGITDSGRRTIATRSGLTARKSAGGYVVHFTLSARNLPAGNYLVTVEGRLPNGGWEPVDDYVFRVVK